MGAIGAPVRERVHPVRWARENLFGSALDTALTIFIAALGIWALRGALRFVFSSARWEIIRDNVPVLLVGLFPRGELWRVWTLTFAVVLAASVVAGAARAARSAADPGAEGAPAREAWVEIARRSWPLLLLVGVLVGMRPSATAVVLLAGLAGAGAAGYRLGALVPPRHGRWVNIGALATVAAGFVCVVSFGGVGWDRWGGLLLTLFLAVAGVVISFPFGVLLALGRRSTLPGVRVVCVGYIELIRGVPLITLLFMGSFVIGFLFPPGTSRPSLVTRALIAIIAFTAAYIAEIVRGGLQAVPRGQLEAAQAVGLSPIKAVRLVVLPQALRAVIPAIVGQFISLFKDTSLVAIIGLTDLLRVGQGLTSQPRFLAQGLQAEVLVFVSFVYWVGAYSMSKASQRLEMRLGVGTR